MIRSVYCTFALAFSLAACGQGNQADTNGGSTAATGNDLNVAQDNGATAANTAAQPANLQPAVLRTADGQEAGTVSVRQAGSDVVLTVTATNLPQGERGMHIHTAGRCEGPTFESAGGHWNPGSKQHGKLNPAGAHRGDMDNLVVGADGRGTATVTLAGASLSGGDGSILDADGASLMIHQGPDDYRTDPSGDSGSRIACAVLGG